MEDNSMPHLPMDLMHKIPTHTSDPASLARLASSCKFWRNLIKDSTFLDRLRRRHSDHGFTPSLLLGFFYQDKAESCPDLWQHHMEQNLCLAPSFMPMSELSRLVGSKATRSAGKPLSLETFIEGLGAGLNFYEPIASQDSFLALRGCSQDTNGALCICNPLTGEIFDVPATRYVPDHYALFVTDDGGLDARISQSFELVAVWIKKNKFRCLCYSSETRIWRGTSGVPELMQGLYLVSSTPPAAATSHGIIRWLCGSWKTLTTTHVATLHVDEMELSYLELPHEANRRTAPLLANSADGELLLLLVDGLQISLWRHSSTLGSDASSWVVCQTIDMRSSLPLRVVKMGNKAKVRLEMFRGKSGMVVLWIEEEGQFLFSLGDGSMRKIDSEHMAKKYRLCPYEIDWLSCLAITNLVVDGSLALDVGRRKAQGRWRTLMSNSLATNAAP